jgi:hypothetical protein
MAEPTKFEIGQGETFKINIQLKNQNQNNTPVDITDYTFIGQIRENYTTDEIAATFSFTKTLPQSSGSVFVELTPDATAGLTQRNYVYDIYLTSGSVLPVTRRILEGSIVVRPAVTR